MYTTKDTNRLDKELGPVKAGILGKYAKGTLPPGIPQTFDLKGMVIVMPYILKGVILGKAKHSPFFENGESVATPNVLSNDERQTVLNATRA